jgi:hypothetical protein
MEGLSEICLQIPDNPSTRACRHGRIWETRRHPVQDVVRGGGFDKLPPHDLHRRSFRHLAGGRDDSFSNVRLAPGVRNEHLHKPSGKSCVIGLRIAIIF